LGIGGIDQFLSRAARPTFQGPSRADVSLATAERSRAQLGNSVPDCRGESQGSRAARRDQDESVILRLAGAMTRVAGVRPIVLARATGALYLLTILTGTFAQGFIAERLIVPGDAAATATSVLAHRRLFQTGFTIYLVEMTCQIVSTVLFYELLRPVDRTISLMTAVIGLVGCTVKTVSRLFFLAPLLVLDGAQYLSAFNVQQRQALALLLLDVNDHGAGIALAFFGFAAVLKGYLIARSTFLPRVLGLLAIPAGVALLSFLSPTLGYKMFGTVAALGLVAAVPQIVWLLVFGVNEQRWQEQAAAHD
jgi:uncharacterized protein DUF4386